MCRSLYILFVDRRQKRDAVRVNKDIEHTLAMGDGITVFAESRISAGRDVEPFKSALIQPALIAGVPVHHAAITYATRPGHPPANRVVGWWRPEPLLYHFRRYLKQPGCTATITFGDTPIQEEDRKLLAKKLTEAVRANFTPVQ
jgi:1-acyl-sn-glycerol-3-phosphate acyltransferase